MRGVCFKSSQQTDPKSGPTHWQKQQVADLQARGLITIIAMISNKEHLTVLMECTS